MPLVNKPFINATKTKEIETIITQCELELKTFIRDAVLRETPLFIITQRCKKICKKHTDKLDVPNKDEYYRNMMYSCNKWYYQFYNTIISVIGLMMALTPKAKPIKIVNELAKAPNSVNNTLMSRYFGSVQVPDYQRKIKEALTTLGRSPMDTIQVGRRKMTVFAQTELQLRYDHHMEELDRYLSNGEVLKRFSSHAGCSERCEHWQGKLVHLTDAPIDSTMWTGKTYKGEKIYSFTGITSQVDKYGYTNNIYVGFNCRHKLLDIDIKEPIYTKDEIERDRKVNSKMRYMERYIKNAKMTSKMMESVEDRQKWSMKAKAMKEKYINYAEKNDIAWYDWRTKV